MTTASRAVDVGPGSTLGNFEIHHTAPTAITNLALAVSGSADRVFVESSNHACVLDGDGAAIRNSVCWTRGDLRSGVLFAAGSLAQSQWAATLRNVTVFAEFGYGISVEAGDYKQLVLNATNVSSFGEQWDVVTKQFGTQGVVSAIVNLDHSLFELVDVVDGGLVTPPGSPTNSTAIADFVDVTAGDFHQQPGSPTVDAGVTSAANGAVDLDGRARARGASTDIGAYEVPVAGQSPGGTGSGTTSSGLSADKTNPVASVLDVQPDAFAALSGRGSSVISAKGKPAKGATVKYRLSEAATVTFTVERVARGRKKKGRCVAGRRKGKACTSYKKLKGSFTHAGAAGANSLRFSGRLANKPLRPGRYRLLGTARDAAGNNGKAVRTSFRIVRG